MNEFGDVFVVTCGCGAVTPNAKRLLSLADASDVSVFESSGNKKLREFLKEAGLKELVPALAKPKHSVLVNLTTGKYVNMLGAKRTAEVISNIQKVAKGI